MLGLVFVLVGCTESIPPSVDVASSGEARFLLLVNRDGFCPTAGGIDVTFRIDPAASELITALGSDGRILYVRWPVGFYGGTASDPVVRDPKGQIVARNDERLNNPPKAFPDLHGYSVCFEGDTRWIQGLRIGLSSPQARLIG